MVASHPCPHGRDSSKILSISTAESTSSTLDEYIGTLILLARQLRKERGSEMYKKASTVTSGDTDIII